MKVIISTVSIAIFMNIFCSQSAHAQKYPFEYKEVNSGFLVPAYKNMQTFIGVQTLLEIVEYLPQYGVFKVKEANVRNSAVFYVLARHFIKKVDTLKSKNISKKRYNRLIGGVYSLDDGIVLLEPKIGIKDI